MDKKVKNIMLTAAGAGLGGLSAAVVASHVAIYDKIFVRYERPDYSLTPGIVCLDRIKEKVDKEEVSFYSDDVLLKGNYFYVKKPKGIVLMAHGIRSGGDDYLNIVLYFIKHNYNVFSFNYKGTYDSEGDSTVGLCESLVDVDHAIDYLLSNSKYNKLPLFLFGHSWGGYAVSSVLSLQDKIKACACVSGMNSGYTMMVEKASQYVGKLSSTAKPFFDIYQKLLFKEYTKYNATMGINKSNIPIVIAHGVDDKVIVFDKQSIISHYKDFTNKKIKYYIGKGYQGDHTDIMFSINAIAYQKEIESEIKLLEMKKGSKLTNEELVELYKNVDHYRYSEVNEELMNLIIKTFDSTL